MSHVTDIIFNYESNYLTSPYGKRAVISTSAGDTSSFHNGADYGTNGKKLPQFALEDGIILSCGTAADGANYIWISYPRIGKKLLHYHLDSISVKAGQRVAKGTKLGTTGMTGKATGIHLHLGVKDLDTNKYEDPEIFSNNYTEPAPKRAGAYKVTADILNVRTGAAISYAVRKFSSLTREAQRQIKALCGYECNGYVKGVVCDVSQVENRCWGKTPSGWIDLDYCTEL